VAGNTGDLMWQVTL